MPISLGINYRQYIFRHDFNRIKYSVFQRFVSKRAYQIHNDEAKTTGLYIASVIVFIFGTVYASSPLYKMICQKTGLGGTVTSNRQQIMDTSRMIPVKNTMPVTIHFTADASASMPWKFTPCQREVTVIPGETALAFYNAKNTSKDQLSGIATYNIVPASAASYFNKIQCFCFEEQTLKPGESVDMPVYFYLDPDFVLDDALMDVQDIVLSYTFFPAKQL